MKKIKVLAVLMCAAVTLFSQEKSEGFKPHGKPVIKIFTNWHQGFGDDDFDAYSGFQLTRGVVGYEHYFTPRISSKVIVDTDDPGEGKLTEVAYMRNAYIAYKGDKLDAYFGIIGLKQFKEQENNWGYRYIYKSAMDEYKFNNSVDAGAYVKYKFTSWLSADFTISNGEGAKKQQDSEGKYRTGYGLTLKPIKNITIRSYYDYHYSPSSTDLITHEDQSSIAFFLGYTSDKLRIGAEYNKLWNFKFDGADDRDLYSVYSTVKVIKDLQLFARYDVHEAEYSSKSEHLIIAGIDYAIAKGVKVSPNIRYGDFAFSSSTPNGEGALFFMNFEYKF